MPVSLFHPALPLSTQTDLIGRIFIYIYFAVLAILCFYGMHRYLMVYLFYKHRKNAPKPKKEFDELPVVTVQLPIFNELYVTERLIDSVCAMRYPREKLQVQVLDDSTDETQELAQRKVQEMRARGVDIEYIHRVDRTGYKAGALDHGLKTAKGRFVAIFDADFVPNPDFLERTIHHFTDDEVGCLQTRWGHINRHYSMLTYVQSILLDGHMIMEHAARNRSGRFFNFSGTAGIWRREAIETAGGWQHDTLTEDLDLSFRAQLEKWKFVFLPEVETPAELPVEMNGYKSQQHRWVKGSMQTSKKLLVDVAKADLPIHVKSEAILHLTGNTAYFLMFVLSMLMFPVAYFRPRIEMQGSVVFDLIAFVGATVSVCVFYLLAQWELYGFRQSLKTFLFIPLVLSMGIGMCVSNARAVLSGLLFGMGGEFVRTPKYKIERNHETFLKRKYKVNFSKLVPIVELLFGIGFAFIVYQSIVHEMYGAIPFQALFCLGFFYVSFLSLFQGKLTTR